MQRVTSALIVVAIWLGIAIGFAAAADAAGAAQEDVRVERGIVWRTVEGEQLTLDAYLPATDRDERPAVLLVHGGGWRAGNATSLAEAGQELARAGYLAFSVNYRLAPQHPYPAAVEDVQAAVEWSRAPRQVREYGIDPDRIGALGGSAGGHLVGMLATVGDGPLDEGARVRAVVSWSGPMDLRHAELAASSRGRQSVSLFLGCTDSGCPHAEEASPIAHVDASDAAMLLANSTDELVNDTQATSMANALDDAGVENELVIVEGRAHARALMPTIWDDTLAFLQQYLGKPKP